MIDRPGKRWPAKYWPAIILFLLGWSSYLAGAALRVGAEGAGQERLIHSPAEQSDKVYLPMVAATSPGSPPGTGPVIPLAMGMPDPAELCHYEYAFYDRHQLTNADGAFNPAVLDLARICGTKLLVRLHGLSSDITAVGGGLDLALFEERIDDFAGLIDPYVASGTIVAHLTIDEPHDCIDWAGVCPDQATVDRAAVISRQYWPDLPALVNTVPAYADDYTWQHTDEIHFIYAYHKGELAEFIQMGLDALSNGFAPAISWGLQALSGGCSTFGGCSMTPAQVQTVGEALCDTAQGDYLNFVRYDVALLDPVMRQTVTDLRLYCGETPGPPPAPFAVGGLIYGDLDNNRLYDPAVDTRLAGVVVRLTAEADGTVYVAASGDDGRYQIGNLAPGDYIIELDGSSLPPGHSFVASGSIYVGQLAVYPFDFAVRVNGLSGFVFRDYDGNGSYDPPGDAPYPGVVIELSDPGGTIVATTSVDAAGNYAFRGLAEGTYTLTPDPGSYDAGWASWPASRSRTVGSTTMGGLDFALQPPGR